MSVDLYAQMRDLTYLRPRKPEDFWNYPREVHLRRLIDRLRRGSPARIAVYEGPFGSAKTSMGIYHGMWSSCGQLGSDGLPCGSCIECREVLTNPSRWRSRLHEIDGSDENVHKEIVDAFNRAGEGETELWTSLKAMRAETNRPVTIFVDEAQRITGRCQDALLKLLERRSNSIFIFATTDIAKIDGGILSRTGGAIYHFTYPTSDEVVTHLQRLAIEMGGSIVPQLAHRIAEEARCQPRCCLSKLHELYQHNPHITENTWYEVYGSDGSVTTDKTVWLP